MNQLEHAVQSSQDSAVLAIMLAVVALYLAVLALSKSGRPYCLKCGATLPRSKPQTIYCGKCAEKV